MNFAKSGLRKEILGSARRNREAVSDVGTGLLGTERFELPANADSLAQLTEPATGEFAIELGLAEQQDLDELLATRLEIREQSNLLEGVLGERLRLVDDQQDTPALSLPFDEKGIELGHQTAARESLREKPELGADRLEELEARTAGIEQEGDLSIAVEPLEERATKSGLSGPDLPRDRDKSLSLLDSVEQMSEGLPV
jgi:hypothetical protein